MKKFSYPVRCRILDVTGEMWHGLELATPPISRPHIGKEGIAQNIMDASNSPLILITLDDGTILYGYECWWEPIEPYEVII